MATGLFVLDMGKPVRIVALAENLVRLSGYEPYVDIDIIETGLRPGEKLHEELFLDTETHTKTKNNLIFRNRRQPVNTPRLHRSLRKLKRDVETDASADAVRHDLFQLINPSKKK